jgi:hypothetical protein
LLSLDFDPWPALENESVLVGSLYEGEEEEEGSGRWKGI